MLYASLNNRVAGWLLCLLVAACGGGGGGSQDSTSSNTNSGGEQAPIPVTGGGSPGLPPSGGEPALPPTAVESPALQARFNQPMGLARDKDGNLYVADTANYTIRKISSSGTVTTLAGASGVSGTNDGSGTSARFSALKGIAVDDAGNVYAVDNHAVRKISPNGDVTTLAGSPGITGDLDGPGNVARFNQAWGIAAAPDGTLFVADGGNYLVRMISPGGQVSTYAGTRGMRGTADGSRQTATFLGPQGIGRDPNGNLYVTDWFGPPAPNIPEGSTFVRRIAVDGTTTTLAGTFNGETGPATFLDTYAICADGAGNVYVAAARTVHKVTPSGTVSTMAGPHPDFQSLEGLAIDDAGNVYVADRPGHAISRVTQDGVITLFAGKMGEPGAADAP